MAFWTLDQLFPTKITPLQQEQIKKQKVQIALEEYKKALIVMQKIDDRKGGFADTTVREYFTNARKNAPGLVEAFDKKYPNQLDKTLKELKAYCENVVTISGVKRPRYTVEQTRLYVQTFFTEIENGNNIIKSKQLADKEANGYRFLFKPYQLETSPAAIAERKKINHEAKENLKNHSYDGNFGDSATAEDFDRLAGKKGCFKEYFQKNNEECKRRGYDEVQTLAYQRGFIGASVYYAKNKLNFDAGNAQGTINAQNALLNKNTPGVFYYGGEG